MADRQFPVTLPDDCWLYPAAKNLAGIDKVSGQFLRGPFLRKGPNEDGTPRDINGVSVTLSDGRTEEETISAIKTAWKPHAIGKLLLSDVRSIEPAGRLDAVQDRPQHANITGLPAFGENVAEAERLATELAKRTTVVFIRRQSGSG